MGHKPVVCFQEVLVQLHKTVVQLQTAISEGLSNVKEVLANPVFDPIRSDSAFQELLRSQDSAS